ncbi:tyrosine-type recombinase/integrase [Psychrobacillus sp. FSL K6-2684]|uniref:tyrosine-type recombinase/integrase n=1 Tax=Psychrobacillus sp. FSL K6-1267 TaxID=2921543 RepID=UPI0030FAF989
MKVIKQNVPMVDSLKEHLQNKELVPFLQQHLDEADKYNTPKFQRFTDTDMMVWFLHHQSNIDRKKDRSDRTIREYEKELSLFVEQLVQYANDINLDIDNIIEGSLFKSLQTRHLRRYQEWLVSRSPYVLKNKKYSPATIERKTTIIKSFFSFLYKEGYINEPIHFGLKKATVRLDERPNRDLGPQEVEFILDAFKDSKHFIMFSIVYVLVTTGIRNEEFCKLQVKDLKKDTILGGYYLDVLGKGNKRRHVPLKSKVIDSIKMFRNVRGISHNETAEPSAPLFCTNSGKHYSPSYLSQYVSKEINKMYIERKGENIKVTPHYFRHAFAIISRLNQVDVHDIKRSLGHERLETTEIYLTKVFEKENHAIHSWKPGSLGEYI